MLPKKGTDSLQIVAAGTASQSFVGTPLDVTVGMGGQCTSGTMTLRQKSATRAVFPWAACRRGRLVAGWRLWRQWRTQGP